MTDHATCAGRYRCRISDWVGVDMLVELKSAATASKVAGWRSLPGAGAGVVYNKTYFDALFEGHLDDVSLLSTVKFKGRAGKHHFAFERASWVRVFKWLFAMCHARHVQLLVGYALDDRNKAKLNAFRGLLFNANSGFDAEVFARDLVDFIKSKLGEDWDGISFDIEVPITQAQLGGFGPTLPDQIKGVQDRFRALYAEVAKAIGPDRILAYAPAGCVSFDPSAPFTYHNRFPQTLVDVLTRPLTAAPPTGGRTFRGNNFHYLQTFDARFGANNIICRPMIYDGITNSDKDEQQNWYWEVLRVALNQAKAQSKVATFVNGQLPQFQVGVKLTAGAGVPNTHLTPAEVADMAGTLFFNSTAGIAHFAGASRAWRGADLKLNWGAPKSCGVLLQMALAKPWTSKKSNALSPF